MLLTITTTHQPATDLGYLLHKNPANVHSRELPFGKAYVFFPEAGESRTTAALLLDVDPVELVRGSSRGGEGLLSQYVNDRPYAASSLLSVAMSRVFGQTLNGKSKERQQLADTEIPLEIRLAALPCRGGEELVRRLFEPLGYEAVVEGRLLDEAFPDWGPSRCFAVTLRARARLATVLGHVYTLIPVLDDEKHYWVSEDEVDKLLKKGEGWLADHPERDLIARRYLRRQRSLTRLAIERLTQEESAGAIEAKDEEVLEQTISLQQQRMEAVLGAFRACGARRVLDLGCGEGSLLRLLIKDEQFEEIVGLDVSIRALERAASRLKLDRLPERRRNRIKLTHGALTYRDERLTGFDAAAAVEVVEHLDPPRLEAFERVLFEFARPRVVVLTTPNVEYNSLFPTLPAGSLRHRDHRFEWTRAEFHSWCNSVSERFSYRARFLPVGPEDPTLGAPTQMVVFEVSEDSQ